MRYIVLGAAIALIFVAVMVGTGEKKTDEGDVHQQSIRDAVDLALQKYSRAIVQNAERIFQERTDRYTKRWTFNEFSPGMDAYSSQFPYGWDSLKDFWQANPQYAPIGTTTNYHDERENNMPLVQFPTFVAGFMTLCEFLQLHKNYPGRWISLIPALQELYNQEIINYVPAYS